MQLTHVLIMWINSCDCYLRKLFHNIQIRVSHLIGLEIFLGVNKLDREVAKGRGKGDEEENKREKTGYIKLSSIDRGKCYEIRLNCFRPVFFNIDRFNINTWISNQTYLYCMYNVYMHKARRTCCKIYMQR